MNSSWEEILVVVWFTLITLFCEFATFVVQKYHRDKPLGMQTLHGKIIEEVFMPALQISAACICLAYMVTELFGPVPYDIAVILQLNEFFNMATFQLSLLMVLIVKYLSIYNGSLIDSFDEDLVISGAKVITFGLPWLFMVFEYSFWTEMEQALTFQQKYLGYSKPDSKMEKMKIIGNLSNFAVILLSQGRIEYDHIKRNEALGCLAFVRRLFSNRTENDNDFEENLTKNMGYRLSALRIAFGCGAVFVTIIYFQATSGTDYSKLNSLILATLISVIGPAVFISYHDGMRKVAFKQLKDLSSPFLFMR